MATKVKRKPEKIEVEFVSYRDPESEDDEDFPFIPRGVYSGYWSGKYSANVEGEDGDDYYISLSGDCGFGKWKVLSSRLMNKDAIWDAIVATSKRTGG